MRLRKARWAGHEARTYLAKKPEGKRPFAGLRSKREDNNKMILKIQKDLIGFTWFKTWTSISK
jgi:hypothetical protein